MTCARRAYQEEPAASGRTAICIPTYRRPDDLFALLGSLEQLEFADGEPDWSVVVVDNDPQGSAREAVEAARACLRAPLTYAIEKTPGVPAARNAAVAIAMAQRAQWIAFVDDDERVEPGWLDALLRAQRSYDADVVTGPVDPHYDADPPRWLRDAGFYAPATRLQGSTLGTAYTHNVLVRTRCLERLPQLFDPAFDPMGEDRELFERIAASGGRIVWSAAARVSERIPTERMALGWILRRAHRIGVAASRIDRKHQGDRAALRVGAHGLWCLGRGAVEASTVPIRGRAAAARGLRLVSYGLGRLRGWLRGQARLSEHEHASRALPASS